MKTTAVGDGALADYRAKRCKAGGAVAGGGSVGALRNQNGVVINGITTQQGVRLTLAASQLSITLTQ